PLRDLERLCLVHRLLPFPVGQWPRPNNAAPSLRPHYRAFHATTGCSAPALRIGTLALAVGAFAASPFAPSARRSTGSHVPYDSLVELRAAYMPDVARAVSGIPRADPGGRCYGAATRILRPSSLM